MSLTPVPRRDAERDPVVVPLARAPIPDGPRQTGTSAIAARTLGRRWVVISILAHLLIIEAILLGLFEPPQPIPPPVLKITLVPRGPGGEGASGGGGASAATPAQAAPEPSKPDIPPPAPEPVAPPPQPEMPPPTPPQPEIPPPQPEPIRQPPQTPPTPQPPQPMATAVPPPVIMEIPPTKPRHIPPRRQAARPHEAPAQPSAPTLTPSPAPAPAAPGASAGPAAPGPGKGIEGAGKGAIGNTLGPGDDYLEKLYRHLLRYKKYPPEAVSTKQQGAVVIGFTLSRDGTIGDAHIEKGSGFPALDDATLAMVRRASPAPRLPDGYKSDTARVKFRIDYKLSLLDQMF